MKWIIWLNIENVTHKQWFNVIKENWKLKNKKFYDFLSGQTKWMGWDDIRGYEIIQKCDSTLCYQNEEERIKEHMPEWKRYKVREKEKILSTFSTTYFFSTCRWRYRER